MRLWSLHPKYLDARGLVALWREALLARKVLEGKTAGYKNHPQLERFREFENPLAAINSYLYHVYLEGKRRGYGFDSRKLRAKKIFSRKIPITAGQARYELQHLCKKLKQRSIEQYRLVCEKRQAPLELNPLFFLRPGKMEKWEKRKRKQTKLKNLIRRELQRGGR